MGMFADSPGSSLYWFFFFKEKMKMSMYTKNNEKKQKLPAKNGYQIMTSVKTSIVHSREQ